MAYKFAIYLPHQSEVAKQFPFLPEHKLNTRIAAVSLLLISDWPFDAPLNGEGVRFFNQRRRLWFSECS
jgi:hypothetical protein